MKAGRNDPCPCGSGKKYKHCCYAKESIKHDEPVIAAPESDELLEEAAEESGGRGEPRQSHRKDRSRFGGDVKGGGANFRPRQSRGSQRGG